MQNLLKPIPRPLPHTESENFIKNLKQRIKRRVRKRQFLKSEGYSKCLEEICMDSEFQSKKCYSNILKALELQSKMICLDKHRVHCLTEERLIPNVSYFLVRGKLGLDIHLNKDSDSCMTVHGIFMDGRYWPDELGIYEHSSSIAKPVESPTESLAKLRLAGEKQVYIINHRADLEHWLGGWSGIAFIQEKLVRKNIDLSIWLSLEVSKRPTLIL